MEEPSLTPRELQVAVLFAKGMSTEAIGRQILRNQRMVEVTVYMVYKKMSESLNVPVVSLHRRDMYEWLSERGLLPTVGG
jgi:DNA-binding NarL/FixJ family response regulator